MSLNYSFLKWAGGKSRISNFIFSADLFNNMRMPDIRGMRYIEPFLGGGSMYYGYGHRCNEVILSDANYGLVETHRQVSMIEGPERLYRSLCEAPFDEESYYRIREEYNNLIAGEERGDAKGFEVAWRFLYINRHGFNGLFRTNGKGRVNVSYGGTHDIFPEYIERLHECAKKLRRNRFQLLNMNAFDLLTAILEESEPERSFIYIDPPYVEREGGKEFRGYSEQFGPNEARRLSELCKALGKHHNVLVSQPDTGFVREVFRDMRLVSFSESRTISCDIENRTKAKELLCFSW